MIVGGTGYFLRWLLYQNRSLATPEDALPSDMALRIQLEEEINAFLRDFPGAQFEAWESLYAACACLGCSACRQARVFLTCAIFAIRFSSRTCVCLAIDAPESQSI